MLASMGKGTSVQGETLIVEFPTNAESKMTMLGASMNIAIVNACLNEVKSGMNVALRSEKLNEQEKKLKELFGEALTIEEP